MKNKKHLLVLVGTILFFTAGRAFSLMAEDTKSLVGWWKFEEPAWTGAAGEAKDSSGRGNDLTARGGGKPPAVLSVGKTRVGEFTASESQCLISVVDNPYLAVGTGDFTLAAWVKSNNPSTKTGILGQYTDGYASCCYGFYQRNSSYYFVVNGPNKGEKWPLFIASPIRSGWHYLTGVRQGDKVCLYVDGKLSATGEGAAGVNPDLQGRSFLVAAGTSDNVKIGAFFDGQITDVKLFKSALTQVEIVAECDRLKDVLGEKQQSEMVLYQQNFEKYNVGDKNIEGINYIEGADVTVTDNTHYTSTRALKITYHPELKQSHCLDLSPRLPVFTDGILKVSLRTKFEDVVDPQNRAWLYPYIRVNAYDQKSVLVGNYDVITGVKKTESKTSVDDNWIMLNKEITLPEDASTFILNLYMYEMQGVRGTVYLDDVRIIERFKQ